MINSASTMVGQPVSGASPTLHVRPGTLARASAGAAAVAAVVLVLFVLPAEAGIDPTGVGGALGLTGNASGEEAAASQAPAAAAAPGIPARDTIAKSGEWREDEMTIELPPHSGKEAKAHMAEGDSFLFSWSAEGGPVRADMHGERSNGPEGEFTSYWDDPAIESGQGTFTAPFEGTHGWYWRNKGDTPVTVTVRTSGFYQDLFLP